MKWSFNFGQELRRIGEGVLRHFDKIYYELVKGALPFSQELQQIRKESLGISLGTITN